MLHLNSRQRDRGTRDIASFRDSGSLHLNYSSSLEPAPELTVQVVRSLEGVAELEGDFARLQAVTGNTLPFAPTNTATACVRGSSAMLISRRSRVPACRGGF
jgi:hypothetical protein